MSNLPTLQEIQSLEKMANTIAKTTFFGKLSPEDVMLLFFVARDLDLPRSVVLAKGLNVINGSVEIAARTMNMLIRKRGHQMKVIACNDVGCKLWAKRNDTGEEMEVSYTIEDARKARLIREGGGWTKNPSDMCFARALSRMARRLFPDCIGNCYIEGEIDERVSKEPIEAPDMSEVEIEVKETKPVELNIPQGIEKEKVEEYLQLLSEELGRDIPYLTEQAALRPEQFWNSFHAWEEKKFQEQTILDINIPMQEPEMAYA